MTRAGMSIDIDKVGPAKPTPEDVLAQLKRILEATVN